MLPLAAGEPIPACLSQDLHEVHLYPLNSTFIVTGLDLKKAAILVCISKKLPALEKMPDFLSLFGMDVDTHLFSLHDREDLRGFCLLLPRSLAFSSHWFCCLYHCQVLEDFFHPPLTDSHLPFVRSLLHLIKSNGTEQLSISHHMAGSKGQSWCCSHLFMAASASLRRSPLPQPAVTL